MQQDHQFRLLQRAPIQKEISPSQTVTTTVLPSSKVLASLSLVYVPRNLSPVITDYIHPRLEICGPEYRNILFVEAYQFKKLANKCLNVDKS